MGLPGEMLLRFVFLSRIKSRLKQSSLILKTDSTSQTLLKVSVIWLIPFIFISQPDSKYCNSVKFPTQGS